MTSPHGKKPEPPTTNLDKESSDYRAACPGFKLPPLPPHGKTLSEAHHLVCVQSINERRTTGNYPEDPATNEYVEACLQLSAWDINGASNLMGMPTNLQHSLAAGTNPANVPSHQVDHNNDQGYRRKDLKEYLRSNVWNTVTAKKDPPHQQDVENIKKQLEDASAEMKRRLTVRGLRGDAKKLYVGTAANWEHRLKADCSPTWYMPFSMADDPTPRVPPVDKIPLSKIFKKLE